jgi:hypothetical protein
MLQNIWLSLSLLNKKNSDNMDFLVSLVPLFIVIFFIPNLKAMPSDFFLA